MSLPSLRHVSKLMLDFCNPVKGGGELGPVEGALSGIRIQGPLAEAAKVRGEPVGMGNAYEREYNQLAGIKSMFDARKVAGVAIHHDTKATEGDIVDRISGTRAASGAADVLIHLGRTRGEEKGVMTATGRDIDDVQTDMIFNKSALTWTVAPGETGGQVPH